jgi:hypothetical protein
MRPRFGLGRLLAQHVRYGLVPVGAAVQIDHRRAGSAPLRGAAGHHSMALTSSAHLARHTVTRRPSSSAYQCPGRGHRTWGAQRRRCAIGMRQPWTRRSRRLLVTMTVTSRVPGRTAEVLGHKHVVHIAAVDEELFAQSPLLAEAETFVQAQRRIVRAQHP